MLKSSTLIGRLVAVTTLAGGLALAAPLHAAPADTSEPPLNEVGQTPGAAYQTSPDQMQMRHSGGMGMNSGMSMKANAHQGMREPVEQRIKTLHAKLGITSEQEPAWNDFAQAMRDNEANIHQLIEERHRSPETMTAVEDLQSYQKIARAHVDGLKRLIPAFQSLYDDMSDDQKQKADKVFSRYEGHPGAMSARKPS